MNVMQSMTTARRLLGIALGMVFIAALGLPASATLMQEDDPFADELNPFGTGKSTPRGAVPPRDHAPAETAGSLS